MDRSYYGKLMSKVTLAGVGSLIDATTAATTINNNSTAIVAAIENTLSRDGTQPNSMGSSIDMNNNKILNLPPPGSSLEPVRLQDLETFSGGGTIVVNPLPTGGTTGQILNKNSNTNFDAGWVTNHPLVAGGTTGQVLKKNSGTDYDVSWGAATIPPNINSLNGHTGAYTTSGLIQDTGSQLFVSAASASDQETATSTTAAVTPSVQQRHPASAKAWAFITVGGGVSTLIAGYNVAGLSRVALGQTQIGFAVPFSSSSYAVLATTASFTSFVATVAILSSNLIQINTFTPSTGAAADGGFFFCAFGDQ